MMNDNVHPSEHLRHEMERRAAAEEELAFLKGVILRADPKWGGVWCPIMSDWQALAARYGDFGERFMDGMHHE